MYKKIISLIWLSIFLNPAFAEDTISFSRLLNIDKSLKQQADAVNPMLKTIITRIYNNYLDSIDNPNQKQLAELKRVYDSETPNAEDIMNIKAIGHLWESTVNKEFSDKELIEISKFYGSPLGQRFVHAMNEANEVMTAEFSRTYRADMDKFAQDFYNKLDKAANCCAN